MRILIVYSLPIRNDRSTITEYLHSFSKYSGAECLYLNTAYGIPAYLYKINFDLVLFHQTFLSLRWAYRDILSKYYVLKELKGYKMALPQDEYVYTDSMNRFFQEVGVKTVYTCLPSDEWLHVYPRERSGVEHFATVFTGYVDESAVARIAKVLKPHAARTIDVGYRAWKAPYWLGRHGQLKWMITEQFRRAACKSGLRLDLSNDDRHIFRGDDWYGFLADCRVVLGCEGGASLLDADGSIRRKTESYMLGHPQASFSEVEEKCFPGLDGTLKLSALSPRHFEACITRTCQVLIEGEYGEVLKPAMHYIEIKRDWSNIDEVVERIQDVDYCQEIADNAYRDIVESGKYTYRKFIGHVLDFSRQFIPCGGDSSRDDYSSVRKLQLREQRPSLYAAGPYLVNHFKQLVYRLLLRLNIYHIYKMLDLKAHQ